MVQDEYDMRRKPRLRPRASGAPPRTRGPPSSTPPSSGSSRRGPAGIRLQEVAADVGLSHPTVLHHFGSREGLVEAVVARALDSLHAGLLEAVRASPQGTDQLMTILDGVLRGARPQAATGAPSSGSPSPATRRPWRGCACGRSPRRSTSARAEHRRGEEPLPTFEDTYFTVLLPALALLAMSVTEVPRTGGRATTTSRAARRGSARGSRGESTSTSRRGDHLASYSTFTTDQPVALEGGDPPNPQATVVSSGELRLT